MQNGAQESVTTIDDELLRTIVIEHPVYDQTRLIEDDYPRGFVGFDYVKKNSAETY